MSPSPGVPGIRQSSVLCGPTQTPGSSWRFNTFEYPQSNLTGGIFTRGPYKWNLSVDVCKCIVECCIWHCKHTSVRHHLHTGGHVAVPSSCHPVGLLLRSHCIFTGCQTTQGHCILTDNADIPKTLHQLVTYSMTVIFVVQVF